MLTQRVLNRTLLARQGLLDPFDQALPEVLEQVGGIQMQYAPCGYVGSWSRMVAMRRDTLTAALEQRRIVQATLLRATIHLVTPADYWRYTAGVRRARQEWWLRTARGRKLPEVDYGELARVVRAALGSGTARREDLIGALVSAGYPKVLWEGVVLWVDLVRAPPSGTWARRRADLFALADDWLAPVEVAEADGITALVAGYLRAFGPAPAKDIASWAGLPAAPINAAISAMGLTLHRDEAGATLVDLPGLATVDADAPAPVRLLPTWDATLLVHARRTGVLPEHLRPRVFTNANPQSVGTVLVDGAVAGSWSWRDDHVTTELWHAVPAGERRAVTREADRLTAFYRTG
jgi:hypothetical protein